MTSNFTSPSSGFILNGSESMSPTAKSTSLRSLSETSMNKSFFDIANSPLKQYTGKTFINNQTETQNWHPLNGDFLKLPYRDNTFDFICSLDTLEHVQADKIAVSEISRILKNKGIVVVTVPHRIKYFSNQDKLIGHKHRYEIHQILKLFKKFNLKFFNLIFYFSFLSKLKGQMVIPNNAVALFGSSPSYAKATEDRLLSVDSAGCGVYCRKCYCIFWVYTASHFVSCICNILNL